MDRNEYTNTYLSINHVVTYLIILLYIVLCEAVHPSMFIPYGVKGGSVDGSRRGNVTIMMLKSCNVAIMVLSCLP